MPARTTPRNPRQSRLRTTLIAGFVGGAIAGVVWGLLVLLLVNPVIREAEGYELASEEPPVVSEAQRDAGTVLGFVVLGALGGLFLGGASHVLRPLYPAHWSPVRWGTLLGVGAFVVVFAVPTWYHPALPPAVEATPEGFTSVEEGTPVRQAGYAAVLAAGVAGAILASVVWNRFTAAPPRRAGFGLAASLAAFLGVAVLPLLILPRIHYEGVVPQELIYRFQAASAASRFAFWVLAGWLLGLFTDRWTVASSARRSTT